MTPVIIFTKTHGVVRPDKIGVSSDRPASRQPYRPTVEFQSTIPSVQSRASSQGVQSPEARVPITAQVKRFVKEQITRLAKNESGKEGKLSVSEVAASILEQGVQKIADMRYVSLLEPIIKGVITRCIQAFSNRIASIALSARAEATLARIYNEVILSLILQNNMELFTKYQKAAREEARAILFPQKDEQQKK